MEPNWAMSFFGCFFADAWDPWNIVRGISPEAKDIDDLFWPFDIPLALGWRRRRVVRGCRPCDLVSTWWWLH